MSLLCILSIKGDYIDDADLGNATGVGSAYGLTPGRHIRINTPNIQGFRGGEVWTLGPKVRAEGVYACYSDGSCLAPDLCSCTDGFEGTI